MDNPTRQAVLNVRTATSVAMPTMYSTPPTSPMFDQENIAAAYEGNNDILAPESPSVRYDDPSPSPSSPSVPRVRLSSDRTPLQELPIKGTSVNGGSDLSSNTDGEQSVFDSSPITLHHLINSSSNDVLGPFSAPSFVIYEDPVDADMSDQSVTDGQHTPFDLYFEGLSLADDYIELLPSLSASSPEIRERTSVCTLSTSILGVCVPGILSTDVVISFDQAKQATKIGMATICEASQLFAHMLNYPVFEGQTRCISLRDDFPYGVQAMIEFITTGCYIFDHQMRVQYPKITLLDLHIHAYIVGAKYGVVKLADYAITQYMNIGNMILSMGVPSDSEDSGQSDKIYDQLFDSLVLLWKNTDNREDKMRAAVLRLITANINLLRRFSFFITLMTRMVGFGDDIVNELQDSGLYVDAQFYDGQRLSMSLRF